MLHRLELHKGGLTKAWLGRVRLFASAGWSVHVALLSADPKIDETLRVLRSKGQLPESVSVHHFSRGLVGLSRRLVVRVLGTGHVRLVTRWLDRVTSAEGALVFADSPLAYNYLALLRNPRVATVYVIHLAHLSTEATGLEGRHAIANGPMTLRFSKVSDATMRAANRIVVLTDAQKEDFQLRWGEDLPVAVIPHCAEPVTVPDVSYDPQLVVVIGRLDYYKRWDHAIRIMDRVLRRVPDARLRIYGRGEDLDRLQAVTQELGLTESVTFEGYTTSPLEVMAGAACVISTTRREAMPLTLLETLAVGTPVVVYDIRYGPREVVRDGIDGFVIPAHDIKAAARAVVRLLTEPELRERMSQSAREVTARFSREAHDKAWLELGRDLYQEREKTAGPHLRSTRAAACPLGQGRQSRRR